MSKEPNIGIQFRARTEAPSEPGWFHARRSWVPDEKIRPVQVIVVDRPKSNFHGVLRVAINDHSPPSSVTSWHWFGPVQPVEEATT